MHGGFGYRFDQKGYDLWISPHDQVQALAVLPRERSNHNKAPKPKNLSRNTLLQLTKSLNLDLGARFIVRRRGFFGPHQIMGEFMGQKLIGVPLKGAVKWDLLGLSDEARETFVELLRQKGSLMGYQ